MWMVKLLEYLLLLSILLHNKATTLTSAEDNLPSKCCEQLRASGIITDLIESCPEMVLEIKYPQFKITCDKKITPVDAEKEPKVSWKPQKDKILLLMMIDPDAPSRTQPTYRSWNHWIVGNVAGSWLEEGETRVDYLGPGPPKGTGFHRYVFLLYEQPGKLKFTEPPLASNDNGPDLRGSFNHREYAEKYQLQGPTAYQFFQAQFNGGNESVTAEPSGGQRVGSKLGLTTVAVCSLMISLT